MRPISCRLRLIWRPLTALGLQQVTQASQRADRRPRAFQFAPQAVDIDLDRVVADALVPSREAIGDCLLGRHTPGVVEQDFEHLDLAGGQSEIGTVRSSLALHAVEAQPPNADFRVGHAVRAPQQGTQARQQFLEGERLEQVIVGSGIEPAHPVLDRIARGQNHHGQCRTTLAQIAQHIESFASRKPEIEQHRIVEEAGQGMLGLDTVACPVNREPRPPGSQHDRLAQRGIIFDKQNFHGLAIGTRR